MDVLKTKPYLTTPVTDRRRTFILIPTPLTLNPSDFSDSQAIMAERNLFAMAYLEQPHTQVVLVVPEQIDPAIIDYYFSLLFPEAAERTQARKRFSVVVCNNAGNSITQRLLASKRLRALLTKAVPKQNQAVLICSQVGPDEQRLAFMLQYPIFGLDPTLSYLGTKSGSRAVFRSANVSLPFGREHIRSFSQVAQALLAIKRHDRTCKFALLKLDHSFAGSGHAVVPLTKLPRQLAAIEKHVRSKLRCTNLRLTPDQFLQQLFAQGGVVEEWLSVDQSPSVQLLITPDHKVTILAIYEQQFDRKLYQQYTGANFPARPSLRLAVLRQAQAIGHVLAKQGAIGYVNIDFITMHNDTKRNKRWSTYAVELNAKLTASMLPWHFAQQVTHATVQPDGILKRGRRPVYYVANDAVLLPVNLMLDPAQLIDTIKEVGLQFGHRSHSGMIIYNVQSVLEEHRVGILAVAKSHQAAEQQFEILRRALDRLATREVRLAKQSTTADEVNRNRLVRTFLKYVKIPSPSHQEMAVRAVLREELISLGVKTKVDHAGNLLGTVAGTGTPLLLCAHMDTVKPCERIRPVVRGDMIMTDGTSVLGADDKAGIAAILELLYIFQASPVSHPPLELVFSIGEETFSDGASQLDFSQLRSPIGFVIDGEALNEIDYRSAFLADIEAVIHGKAAHSGIDPEKGVSAIQIAAKAISTMKLGRVDADTTANIGIISGGSIRNAVPAIAYVHGEARSFTKRKIEDQLERMQKALQDAAEEFGGLLELKSKVSVQGYTLSKTDPLIARVQAAIRSLGMQPKLVASMGATDANSFIPHGIKTVNIGTGGQKLHTVEECISIVDMVKATQLLYRLVITSTQQ